MPFGAEDRLVLRRKPTRLDGREKRTSATRPGDEVNLSVITGVATVELILGH
jgi:hypothetical protein